MITISIYSLKIFQSSWSLCGDSFDVGIYVITGVTSRDLKQFHQRQFWLTYVLELHSVKDGKNPFSSFCYRKLSRNTIVNFFYPNYGKIYKAWFTLIGDVLRSIVCEQRRRKCTKHFMHQWSPTMGIADVYDQCEPGLLWNKVEISPFCSPLQIARLKLRFTKC